MKNLSLLIAAFSLGLLFVAGCSSSKRYASADMAAKETASPATAPAKGREASDQANTASPITWRAESKAAQRALIRNGTMTIKVNEVEATEKKVAGLLQASGGYLSSSSSNNLEGQVSQISMTLRVPVQYFDKFVETLSSYGTVTFKQISAEDVTGALVDMDARLKVLRTQEQMYLKVLANSKSIDSSLSVQDRLYAVRQEIESMAGQQKSMQQQAALSTLTLTITSNVKALPTESAGWAQDAWNGASNSFAAAIGKIGKLVIYAVVYSPLWGPLFWLLIWKRRRQASQVQASPAS